jgi:hypothetical protein
LPETNESQDQQETMMDPITTAIVAALAAGAAAGATEVGKQAIADAYDGLKTVIRRKWGAQSELAQAVDSLESNPDSAGRQEVLAEEVAAAQADQDADIVAALQALQEKLTIHGDERIQRMLHSEGGEQIMRGRGGRQEQDMRDSPRGKQLQE